MIEIRIVIAFEQIQTGRGHKKFMELYASSNVYWLKPMNGHYVVPIDEAPTACQWLIFITH